MAEKRKELQLDQPNLNPDRLVFIDETLAKTNMTRPRGRAPKGQRVLKDSLANGTSASMSIGISEPMGGW